MKAWIVAFSAAVFLCGACLGVVLQPRLAPPPAAAKEKAEAAPVPWSGGRHSPPELSVTRFASELGLTDEQDRELDAILGDIQQELQALGRAQRAVHDRSKDRVTRILTEEQRKKLDELLSQERRKRGDADTVRTVETYRKILSLTDDQEKVVADALREGRERRRDLFREGPPGGSPEHIRAAYRQLREEQNRTIEKSLSSDQYRTYVALQELDGRH